MVTIDDVKKAAEVLNGVARRTDLIHSPAFSTHGDIYLKTENLQLTGSFKLRGAYNKIANLSDEEKSKGLIACSAGNHAQGVAYAASKCGAKSVICMPASAPISKVEATKALGAEAVLVPGAYDDAHDEADRLQKEHGYTMILPFDDPYVIAGQGTIGLEILEQLPEADAVITPIGGGGLLAGVATAVKAIKPSCKVYGVQAAGANAMYQSFRKGTKICTDSVATVADGIAVKIPGDLTYEIIREKVDDIVTVTEDEIAGAILALIEKQKLIAEGAGATTVAAALYDKIPTGGRKTVCVVSGGNIDVTILSRVISRGLLMADRKINLTVEMDDKQGNLYKACKIISECGGNVLEVHHDRSIRGIALSSTYVTFELEIKDADQAKYLCSRMEEEGYRVSMA
ncbi:MAG: threonine ammonia-lyase [Ruminococcus sp.]|nr:threonine ammonia-lyase [Ruminococcus sp.]